MNITFTLDVYVLHWNKLMEIRCTKRNIQKGLNTGFSSECKNHAPEQSWKRTGEITLKWYNKYQNLSVWISQKWQILIEMYWIPFYIKIKMSDNTCVLFMFKTMPNSVIGHTAMCNKLGLSMRKKILIITY